MRLIIYAEESCPEGVGYDLGDSAQKANANAILRVLFAQASWPNRQRFAMVFVGDTEVEMQYLREHCTPEALRQRKKALVKLMSE